MDEVFQSWLAIDGPSDELPMAGELIIPVTAYPVLSQTQIDSGVKNSSVTRNIVITVPSITNGTFSITNHRQRHLLLQPQSMEVQIYAHTHTLSHSSLAKIGQKRYHSSRSNTTKLKLKLNLEVVQPHYQP